MNKIFGLKKYVTDNFGIIAAFVYLTLSAIKMRHYLIHGRFWAEEGTFFYSEIVNRNTFNVIFYIFHGHLEIVTNVIVYASTLVSLKHAPLVTTYLSLAAQFIPIYIMIRYRDSLSLSRFNLILIIIIAAGLPQASEVWANSINLHFHFSLLAALIAAISISNGPPKWASRLLLGVSGLSGIPSNFLVPVFAFLAVTTKEKERWIQFFILTFTAFLQILLLVFNDLQSGHREYFSTPLVFWLAPVAQSVISPLFGFSVGNQLASILREVSHLTPGPFVFSIVFSTPLIYLAAIAFTGKPNSISVIILSAFILLFMSIFTALGDKLMLISSAGGGRYFYAPNILLSIAIITSFRKYNIFIAAAIFSLIASSLSNVSHYIKGPSWQSNFEISENSKDSTYKIWPDGWSMKLQNKEQ